MPDRPDREERRRRRLEKRRAGIAEPLIADEPALPPSSEPAPDLDFSSGAPAEEMSDSAHLRMEESEMPAQDLAQSQREQDEAGSEYHAAFPDGARSSLSSDFGPNSAERTQPPHREGMPPPPLSAHPRGRRWTDEPVLLALLAVGLVILAVDTYLTLRLNGFSDRLRAMAAVGAAAPAASADRPWVGSDKITTVAFANGGQPVTTMHIVNSGRAPALDLRSNTVGSLRSASTPPPEIPAQKGPLATTGILFPNMGGNLTFFSNTRALTAEEAGNVKSGSYVLWLAGRLDYKDPKGHLHLTTFRYRYNPQMNAFVAAPDGNSAN